MVMGVAELRAIRLDRFKSFAGAVMPVAKLTVLTGRNNSGKSNALDAIEVLSRLAGGEDIADALDGRRREGGPVRGGSIGCAPHGHNSFRLGCRVHHQGNNYLLSVAIQTNPELRLTEERLWGPAPALESGIVENRWLLYSRPPEDESAGIEAEIHNGKRGVNPVVRFRDNRLLISQLPARLVPQTAADRAVVEGAEAVAAALRGVFHLDPFPQLMRRYVPARDAVLRRTGENLSAAIARLASDDSPTFERLVRLVRDVADKPVAGIRLTTSTLGDVMLALQEGDDPHQITPAREMSDGLLRFLSVATALLMADRGLDIDAGLTSPGDDIASGVLLVIEELENGLHPSQASRVLSLVRQTSERPGVKVAVTTHSPAVLNALPGSRSRNVLVCYRDSETGTSQISRLTDLPGYAGAMAAGRLGEVIAGGDLVRPLAEQTDFAEFNRLLGVE
jgi:predicted ATPase